MKLDRSEIKERTYKYIIRESGETKLYWDISIIVFAIYNSVMTPFNIAFQNDFGENIDSHVIDWIINFIFLIDIFINFRTTFMNRFGVEIYNPILIAKNYIYGPRFWIDLVSSIPFDVIPINGLRALNIMSMLKIVRIFRISKIIQHLNVRKEIKTWMKVAQMLFYLLLFIHIQA